MMNKKWIGWKILGGIIFIPGLLFLAAWVFMLIWNVLMPELLGLPGISFWQGVGLIVLARFLFGNFCGKKRCKCKCRGGKKWEKQMEEEHFREHFDKHRSENSADGEPSSEATGVVGPSG